MGDHNKSVLIGGAEATLVIHLARHMTDGMNVVIVEPLAELGRGVAYSTRDLAHRVNVPTDQMALSDDDTEEATRWFPDWGLLSRPKDRSNEEKVYVGRYDYRTSVSSMLRSAVAKVSGRLKVDHRQTTVKSIARHDSQLLRVVRHRIKEVDPTIGVAARCRRHQCKASGDLEIISNLRKSPGYPTTSALLGRASFSNTAAIP
nr:FAD/NAD(P)-binding protein [Mesorhizobium hawassense]